MPGGCEHGNCHSFRDGTCLVCDAPDPSWDHSVDPPVPMWEDDLDDPLEEAAYAEALMDDPSLFLPPGPVSAEPVVYERHAWGQPDPVSVVKRPAYLAHVVDEVVPFAQPQYDSLRDYFETVHFLPEHLYEEGAAHDALTIGANVPRSVCFEGLPMPRVEGGRFVP